MFSRTTAYVDGYNLYYGLRDRGWKWAYWLDLPSLARTLLKPTQQLLHTHYFTAIVKRPDDKRRRQAIFLEALQTKADLSIHFGHFLAETVLCRRCGHQYETHHEKMTDVNIAVQLMTDAFQDQFDTAILISADSDLVAPIKAVRRLFSANRVIVAFPPERESGELKKHANGYVYLGRDAFAKSLLLLPDPVVKPNGYLLRRPPIWR